MINSFSPPPPPFGFPMYTSRRNPYQQHNNYATKQENKQNQFDKRTKTKYQKTSDFQKQTNSQNQFLEKKNLIPPSEDEEKPMFELFGIKLYQDDILLICLIFFLYNEGIKDEFLFFALILLLLS